MIAATQNVHRRSGQLAAAIALVLATGAQAQEQGRPDTSTWKCEKCPFAKGYEADYSVGATHVSDDSARFGNGTGHDEEGVHAFVEGTGRFVADNYRMAWDLVELGTDARAATITGGSPGVYEYRVAYDELPYRRFDDTRTIFREANDETLVLPAGWVSSPSSAGLTGLNASLIRRNIETDRTTYQLGGEFQALNPLQFAANYRRTEREGHLLRSASVYASAAQFAAPIDDQTDTIDFAVSYTQDRWFAQLGWSGSFYDNSNRAWRVASPFGEAGAQSEIAQAPDNDAQVITLAGAYHFPARTTLSLSASMGEVQQDEGLLAYSINPAVSGPLPRQSFDGQVDTMHYDVRVTSQPLDFLRVRAFYRFDERDNESSVNLWSRTIADFFPSNDFEANRPYSFERSRLGVAASAKFDFWDWLSAFNFEAGYDLIETDRTLQEAPDQEENMGWGRIRWRAPFGAELALRAGASRREIDDYDLSLAAQYEQNPLMRKYNLAYRYREFAELRGTVGFGDLPITLGAEAYFSDDTYRALRDEISADDAQQQPLALNTYSSLGLREADDMRVGVDVTWAVTDDINTYVQAGYEDIEMRTVNSESFSLPDWNADHQDRFRTVGAGVNLTNLAADRLGVRFDVTYAKGEGDVDVESRFAGSGAFPELETELTALTLDADYRLTDALDLRMRLRYEDFASSDWQLEGVEPGTIPQIISLGADPYDYDAYLVTLAVRYSFGRDVPIP